MRKTLIGIAVAAALVAGGAAADPIGPDCGSCFGNVYTLSYDEVTPEEFAITLTIDTADTTLDATDYVAQVAFKATSSSDDVVSATLVSTTAPGAWGQPTVGGLNNGGCTVGEQGFVCSTDGTSALTDGSEYSWLFDVVVTDAAQWLLDLGAASIKANFGPDSGLLTSEPITLQPGDGTGPPTGTAPEPATLALVGLGVLAVGASRRRRGARA